MNPEAAAPPALSFTRIQNRIALGRHPDHLELLFAAGFSGHGMQHAPAVGRGIAELVADGGYATLDLEPLGIERIIAGAKMIERNVV